ncbi:MULTISPECIES: ABC transporter ATP-binding protein [unclassified Pseudodesulfovibrio]|uniref:ABC transporter ATP-binding protein n=1 Tax=unclassified Pseudodesulfovibrio TaxID=2661612 RepID=UPI000FEC0286|nr:MULTISPECIES: ABC transporter ATP-binding protein [unclassified Pseudodesulfovibrio]MCJ2163353.1 ABC transporter ATP-binding protein [Pseudodesulfovibrio sp. S3-i]RWU06592.1 ABC transporter ATP-binding protein [Pseudodesulfovibrio sp. S3]
MPLLRANNIGFSYADTPILDDVSFSIAKGELVSVLGPNGCGKTTLLKVLLGILMPKTGQIFLNGVDIGCIGRKSLAKQVAYVPQVHTASFAYPVKDVVMMGRMPHKSFFSLFSEEDENVAVSAMEKTGILHLKDKSYTQISGGERQLTLIARALAQGARIFILDEPLNGLDYGNQLKLLEQLHELCSEGYTFIKSTHFPDHAFWVSDHVIMLKNGVVYTDGLPNEVITQESLYELYGANVLVMPYAENFRMCIPGGIYSRLCDALPRAAGQIPHGPSPSLHTDSGQPKSC